MSTPDLASMSGSVWVSRRERLERAFIWDSSTEVDWEEEEEEGATPPPEERVAEREGCCRSAITSFNFSTLDEREGEEGGFQIPCVLTVRQHGI